MNVWIPFIIVFAGAIGGVINAIISQNGFIMWKKDSVGDQEIWRPGILGNVIVSGVAAFVSWGFYGPYSTYYIIGGSNSGTNTNSVGLTFSSIAGAILVGITGAKWLTNEIDKNLLRKAASAAAISAANPDKAAKIATATPFDAVRFSLEK